MTAMPPLVVFIVYPGIKLFDLAGPLQVFADTTSKADGNRLYETAVASEPGGIVSTDTGTDVTTVKLSTIMRRKVDTLLVVGGSVAKEAARDEILISKLSRLSARCRRIGSICTGAFLLAEAGLLDGKRAVTHWESCGALGSAFPSVMVDHDPIFIRDGEVWTSAGVSAGVDLALAMVEADYGHATAMDVARSLVVFLKRPGGQSQFSSLLTVQAGDESGRFGELHDWIAEHLHEDLSVEALARQCGMSGRNFSRVYKTVVGVPPARSIELIRLDAAKRMLQKNELSLKLVSSRCGFGDEQRLRQVFLRHLGIPPSDYRAKFGSR
ncbi:MAG: helix-turn-helix domain-containing protein [Pseudomonadota bacterium]